MSAMAQIATSLFTPRGGDLSYGTLKQGFRELVLRDPLDSLLVTVVGGAYLFYLAEKGKNPKCESFWDALVFISTCLSVGYDDVFARTDAGKAIATFVMTFGPAMSGAALDPPAAEKKPDPPSPELLQSLEVQRAIAEKLDGILEALKRLPTTPSDAPAGSPPAGQS